MTYIRMLYKTIVNFRVLIEWIKNALFFQRVASLNEIKNTK